MIAKLVRYESRSGFRYLLLIWAALLALTIAFALFARITAGVGFQQLMETVNAVFVIDKIVNGLLWILYVILFTAVFVLTLAVIVMRFYRGMFGNEGYLAHTLPVKEWQLLTSKGIVASAAILGSIIVACVSIAILAFALEPEGFTQFMWELGRTIGADPLVVLYAVEWIIVGIVGVVSEVYRIYTSLAIGQIANRYRVLLALACYIGIGMVLSTVSTVLGVIGTYTRAFDGVMRMLTEGSFLEMELLIFLSFIVSAIPLVIFHLVTERILRTRLNLL